MGDQIRFLLQLAEHILLASVADFGTNPLGWIFSVGTPIGVVIMSARRAQKGQRWKWICVRWRDELKYLVAIYAVGLVLAVTWEGYSIIRRISTDAASVLPPPLIWQAPKPPTAFLPTSQAENRDQILKQETNLLAKEILEFAYKRQGSRNVLDQQAIAQANLDAFRGNQNGAQQFQSRLAAWDEETQEEFLNYYWAPRVVPLMKDLAAANADLSPIARAVATDDPRQVGLMLSVVAERIGKRPPYARVLTPLEATAIIRGFSGMNMEVYAYSGDQNSKDIAEVLRQEFQRQNFHVDKAVSELKEQTPMLHGIHFVFPSGDLEFNFAGLISGLKACELETTVDLRRVKQPPTILKIEVWPQTPNWQPPVGPNLMR